MAQIVTGVSKYSTIIARKEFRIGIEEYTKGIQPSYDRSSDRAAWTYERGRNFAAACAGRQLTPPANRLGVRVNPAAVSLYIQLKKEGDLL